jgi:hypothetical protein
MILAIPPKHALPDLLCSTSGRGRMLGGKIGAVVNWRAK